MALWEYRDGAFAFLSLYVLALLCPAGFGALDACD